MNNIVRLGLILGAISVVSQLLYKFVLGYDFMFSWKSQITTIVLTAAVSIILGRKFFRDPEDGTLGYGEAVKNLFLSMLLGLMIGSVTAALLFGNDQELNVAYKEYSITAAENGIRWGAELGGASEAKIEEEVAKVREQYENGEAMVPEAPFAFSQLPLSILIGAVWQLIIALILAIFVKKNDNSYSTA